MTPETCFPFFVGRGRSGTTLLRSMFDTHPEMAIPYESHFTVTMALDRAKYESGSRFLVSRYLEDLAVNWGFRRWGLPFAEVERFVVDGAPTTYAQATRLVYRAFAQHHGKTRYGEKTPSFVLHISLLADLFPESRFVHVIRDGRNVALSYRDGGWGPKTLGEAAIYWKRFVRRGREAGLKLGSRRYMEIRYEDLLEDPDAHLRKLCGFIDLEFYPSMLEYFERPDVVPRGLRDHLARGHKNLQLPPTKGLRDWRDQMSRHEAATFDLLAGDVLEELGYERAVVRPGPSAYVNAGTGWLGTQARRALRFSSKSLPVR